MTPIFEVFSLVLSVLGVVLVWVSSAWTASQQALGTAILFGFIFVPILLVLGLRLGLE